MPFEEGQARLTEAAGLWRELGNMTMLNDNLNALLFNLVYCGKYEKALEVARKVLGQPHNKEYVGTMLAASFARSDLVRIRRDRQGFG